MGNILPDEPLFSQGKLKDGAYDALTNKCNVATDNIVEFEVPGSWELPLAARYMALTQKVDAIICIGVRFPVSQENASVALLPREPLLKSASLPGSCQGRD